MKLLDTDWGQFLRDLHAWDTLPPDSRRVFLSQVRPGAPVNVTSLGNHAQLLFDAGLLEAKPVMLKKRYHPFGRVMRALSRHPVQERASAQNFHEYLSEYFLLREREVFRDVDRWHHDLSQAIFQRVVSSKWLEEFLSAKISDWEEKYRGGSMPVFYTHAALDNTKGLVRYAMERGEAIPFRELTDTLHLPEDELGPAILAAIRYLFIFPSLRPADLEPVFGLWPKLQTKRAAKLSPLKPVAVRDAYGDAFLMEDMTAILAAAAAEPLRLRGADSGLFAKAQKELGAALIAPPEWVEKAMPMEATTRLRIAVFFLTAFGLGEQRGRVGTDLRLEPSDAGPLWLESSPKQRLKLFLDRLRKSDELLPYSMYFSGLNSKELSKAVLERFSGLSEGSWVVWNDFLAHQAGDRNPLMRYFEERYRGAVQFAGRWMHVPTEEEMEEAWQRLLSDVIRLRLFPFGCVKLALGPEDAVCIALTGAGRYLTGGAADFELEEEEVSGEVLVQPNFDVVFLAPDPRAEAEIARFAERRGRRMGVLFKITKRSVFVAAASGLSAEHVLNTLGRKCRREAPGNVQREIRGWFAQTRRVRMRHSVLIHCGEKDTAARVLALAGVKAVAITDTIVELQDPSQEASLKRKLREGGVFA